MNSKNAGYGKYYPEVDTQTTLTLRGFAKHMSDTTTVKAIAIKNGEFAFTQNATPLASEFWGCHSQR